MGSTGASPSGAKSELEAGDFGSSDEGSGCPAVAAHCPATNAGSGPAPASDQTGAAGCPVSYQVDASPPAAGCPIQPGRPSAGPVSACPARRRSGGHRGYVIPGVIAMVALLGIGLAFGAGDLDHRATSGLHGSDVAQQLALAIQAQKGSHTPPDVTCPPAEPMRSGLQFSCAIQGNGSSQVVHVEETDGRGHLSWQLGQSGG